MASGSNPLNKGRLREFNRLTTGVSISAARRIVEYTRVFIPSTTLRLAQRARLGERPGLSYLHIPHYWAYYVHEGRGVTRVRTPDLRFDPDSIAVGSAKIRYFPGGLKHLDPRTRGGYPKKLEQIRYLTWKQIEALRVVMVQTDTTGPVKGSYFWTKPRRVAQQEKILAEEAELHLDALFTRLFRKGQAKIPVRISI